MPGPGSDRRLACNSLINYLFLVRNTLQDEKLKMKFYGGDRHGEIKKAVQETSEWLDKNHLKAEKDEIWTKQSELTSVVNPIMTASRFLGKGTGKGFGPREPHFPPPAHLRRGPFTR